MKKIPVAFLVIGTVFMCFRLFDANVRSVSPSWLLNVHSCFHSHFRGHSEIHLDSLSKIKVGSSLASSDAQSSGQLLWFDDEINYGIKLFVRSSNDWFFIASPRDTIRSAYIVTNRGEVISHHDDAVSVHLDWESVKRKGHPLEALLAKSGSDFDAVKDGQFIVHSRLLSLREGVR